MSDVMLFGVLRMPYELAMSTELSRRQFHDRAQQALDEIERLRAFDIERMIADCVPGGDLCDPQSVADALREWARLRAALAEPAQKAKLFQCDIAARPLRYPLSDYHIAMSEGPLHYTWTDKPHRLVYDLIAAVRYYADPAQEAQPVAWPIARLTVDDSGLVQRAGLYAPGLPAGDHDVWLWPSLAEDEIARISAAVVAERERCINILRSVDNHANPMTANDCIDAIRSGKP